MAKAFKSADKHSNNAKAGELMAGSKVAAGKARSGDCCAPKSNASLIANGKAAKAAK